MGNPGMSKDDKLRRRGADAAGFTFLEVLVSTVFLTVAIVTMLQCLAHALQMQVASGEQWRRSLEKWNRCQELRSGLEAGEPVSVLPGARSMLQFAVQADAEDSSPAWEVLRAAK
jgi:Tfp pilus assembly protein PilV